MRYRFTERNALNEREQVTFNERVEAARQALLGSDEEMLAYLRGPVSCSDQSTTPCGPLCGDTMCVPECSDSPIIVGRRCFAACRDSQAGRPCDCNPARDPYAALAGTPWEVLDDTERLDRALQPCPLGRDCLGDGDSCFAVWGALYGFEIEFNFRLVVLSGPATVSA